MKDKKESLFSTKNKKLITDPLSLNNPITVQVLGICSALAVTVQMDNALVMSFAVLVVTTLSNLVISLLRNFIPGRIRIIVQLLVVASLVIIVDQILKAFVFDVSKQLSVFVGLIITNCIVMGRLEAFALANKPWPSILDGIGNGIGYGIVLVVVAFFKEVFGSGTLTIPGLPKLELMKWIGLYNDGSFYQNNGLFLLPPSSLIIVAIYIWVQRKRKPQLNENSI